MKITKAKLDQVIGRIIKEEMMRLQEEVGTIGPLYVENPPPEERAVPRDRDIGRTKPDFRLGTSDYEVATEYGGWDAFNNPYAIPELSPNWEEAREASRTPGRVEQSELNTLVNAMNAEPSKPSADEIDFGPFGVYPVPAPTSDVAVSGTPENPIELEGDVITGTVPSDIPGMSHSEFIKLASERADYLRNARDSSGNLLFGAERFGGDEVTRENAIWNSAKEQIRNEHDVYTPLTRTP